MDKKNIEKYRHMLLERRESLLQAYNKNKSLGTEAAGQASADMADMATNAYTKEFLYSLSNTEREILQAVENALERVEHGSYGECVECEEKIEKKRLQAVPWTRHCVSCQELVESGRLRT